MSKSSRDLSKGIAVTSNGFKYGGGKDEGWGTGQAKGRRLGKGQGERDVAARARLKARLLARTEARAKGELDPGTKRKRDRGDEKGKEKGTKRARANERSPSRTASSIDGDDTPEKKDPSAEPADATRKEEAPLADDAVRFTCSTCGVKCGTSANFDAHRDSKKHKAAAQRAKGKAILEAMRARRAPPGASTF
jgi:hypothetical protein